LKTIQKGTDKSFILLLYGVVFIETEM